MGQRERLTVSLRPSLCGGILRSGAIIDSVLTERRGRLIIERGIDVAQKLVVFVNLRGIVAGNDSSRERGRGWPMFVVPRGNSGKQKCRGCAAPGQRARGEESCTRAKCPARDRCGFRFAPGERCLIEMLDSGMKLLDAAAAELTGGDMAARFVGAHADEQIIEGVFAEVGGELRIH